MKHIFTFLLVALWLTTIPTLAQKRSAKLYIANVSKSGQLPPKELKRRNDEIKFQATTKIKNLVDLLNTLTFEGPGEAERNALMRNSFLPSPDQVFYSDDIVIEDDIDPTHISAENAVDVVVEKYLRTMDLFYVKSDTLTISFSQLITSEVQEGSDSPYIKVFFTSFFNGKHSQITTPYKPVQRVAELRAEKVEGKWRTFITRLAFLHPGEALTQLSKPVIPKDFGPKKPIESPERIYQKKENPIDSITVKSDQNWLNVVRSSIDIVPTGFYQRGIAESKSQGSISIELADQDQKLLFRRIDGSSISFIQKATQQQPPRNYRLRAWLQIATGIIALGASYAGYTSLQNSYSTYTNKLAGLNSEFAIWQTLTQQAGASPAAPVSFASYASPGIYAVYGGGVVGSGLVINGIRELLKAGKIKRQGSK